MNTTPEELEALKKKAIQEKCFWDFKNYMCAIIMRETSIRDYALCDQIANAMLKWAYRHVLEENIIEFDGWISIESIYHNTASDIEEATTLAIRDQPVSRPVLIINLDGDNPYYRSRTDIREIVVTCKKYPRDPAPTEHPINMPWLKFSMLCIARKSEKTELTIPVALWPWPMPYWNMAYNLGRQRITEITNTLWATNCFYDKKWCKGIAHWIYNWLWGRFCRGLVYQINISANVIESSTIPEDVYKEEYKLGGYCDAKYYLNFLEDDYSKVTKALQIIVDYNPTSDRWKEIFDIEIEIVAAPFRGRLEGD